MRLARTAAALGAVAVSLTLSGPSNATTGVGAGSSGFNAHSGAATQNNRSPGTSNTSTGSSAESDVHAVDVCANSSDPNCNKGCPPGSRLFAFSSADDRGYGTGSMTARCVAVVAPQITPGMVQRAFRRIPVPTPTLHIQPVKGTTLVNFKTNFYATGGATFTRTVTLLGHHVTLKIHVDHYDFHFADGHSLTTTDPGAGYPRLTNTHHYLHKGTVRPYLSTTWAADYKVGNGTWQSVTGTVSRTGPTQRLRIITATPVLTGADG